MNVSYCTYDTATGAIHVIGNCDPGMLQSQAVESGCTLLQLTQPIFPKGWYIDVTRSPPAPAQRPASAAAIDKTAISANGTDAATLSGLPNPSTVTVINPDGSISRSPVTAGTFALTATAAGLYRLYVDAFPATDFQTAVTAS
jgi:hypothetical protein